VKEIARRKEEAKREKKAKVSKVKRAVSGASRIVNSVRQRVTNSILVLVGTAVATLTAIYKSLIKVGDLIQKRSTDGIRYNMPDSELERLELFASGRTMLKGDPDVFKKAFGFIMTNFTDPAKLNTGVIESIAHIMQEDVKHFLRFITKEANTPADVFYHIADSIMRVSRAGIAAGMPGSDPDRAFAANINAVNRILGSDIANPILDWVKAVGYTGNEKYHTSYEAYTHTDKFVGTTPNKTGLAPPGVKVAAEDTLSQWSQLMSLLRGLYTDVFANMLARLGDVVMYLRTLLRPIVGAISPEFMVSENEWAIRNNQEVRDRVTYNREVMEYGLRMHAKERGYAEEGGLERFVSVIKSIDEEKDEAVKVNRIEGIGGINKFVEDLWVTSTYFAYTKKLNELDNAVITKDNPALKRLGFPSMVGQERPVSGTDAQLGADATNMARVRVMSAYKAYENVAKKQAEEDRKGQARIDHAIETKEDRERAREKQVERDTNVYARHREEAQLNMAKERERYGIATEADKLIIARAKSQEEAKRYEEAQRQREEIVRNAVIKNGDINWKEFDKALKLQENKIAEMQRKEFSPEQIMKEFATLKIMERAHEEATKGDPNVYVSPAEVVERLGLNQLETQRFAFALYNDMRQSLDFVNKVNASNSTKSYGSSIDNIYKQAIALNKGNTLGGLRQVAGDIMDVARISGISSAELQEALVYIEPKMDTDRSLNVTLVYTDRSNITREKVIEVKNRGEIDVGKFFEVPGWALQFGQYNYQDPPL
jgi:hypothetical protein